jgi:hypothetical protein
MIKVGARQNCRAALLLGRISIGNDQTRPCAALDSRLAVRSPLCDAGSAYRDRPTGFVTPLDRFPNKRSMHIANKPPAIKSP